MATKARSVAKRVDKKVDSVGVRELNHRLSQVLSDVKKGEVVEITEHGRLIAKLVPANTSSESVLEELFASGLLIPAKDPEKILQIKPMKYKGKIPLSQHIINERRTSRF